MGTSHVTSDAVFRGDVTIQGDATILGTLTATVAGTASPTVYFKDYKAAATDGGSALSMDWVVRDLNTVENARSWASLSANQFTLAAGTYEIDADAPAFACGQHRAALYNVTGAIYTFKGSTGYSDTNSGVVTCSNVRGIFTVAGSTIFEIRHIAFATELNDGLGVSADLESPELYTQVKITKLA